MNTEEFHSSDNPESDNRFSFFSSLSGFGHEKVLFCSHPETGLKAIIAIHDTTLGPSLGGVRMWNYQSEAAAIRDVLRLSRGMTYKSAISGLNLGGGKAVIIGDHQKDKNESFVRAFGRFVNSLGGHYITAVDVGMTERDMEWVFSETKHVTGIPEALGGSGDPAPVTAHGVYMGMKAAAKKAYGTDSLEGKRIGIQGAGSVAGHLARLLHKEGTRLFVADIVEQKANQIAKETGAEVVDPDKISALEMDIFSPCALGDVVNDRSLPEFKCDIIAGSANNILDDDQIHGSKLKEMGILYAPDYVINAGGLINVASELEGYNEKKAMDQATRIYDTTIRIFDYSDAFSVPASIASNRLAEERLASLKSLDSISSSKTRFSGRKS